MQAGIDSTLSCHCKLALEDSFNGAVASNNNLAIVLQYPSGANTDTKAYSIINLENLIRFYYLEKHEWCL